MRRRWFAAVAAGAVSLCGVLAACASKPRIPPDLSADALRTRQTGIALVALNAGGRDIFGGVTCKDGSMTFRRLDSEGTPPTTDRAQYADDEKRTLLLFDPELSAGHWGITSYTCTFSNQRTNYVSPKGHPFAHFRVGPGEVVDVGQLTVFLQSHGGIPLLFVTGYTAISAVDPMDASVAAKIKPSLRDRIIKRPMTVDPMLTRPQLEAVCRHEKSRQVGGIYGTPVCDRLAKFAGPTPQYHPGLASPAMASRPTPPPRPAVAGR